jgi:hypothetical protein
MINVQLFNLQQAVCYIVAAVTKGARPSSTTTNTRLQYHGEV